MCQTAAQAIASGAELFEQLIHLRVIDRFAFGIGKQVLLADVGDVGTVLVLGQQVIERLVPIRPLAFGYLFVPFFGIGIDRVNIEDDTAKIEIAMFDDIPDGKESARPAGRIDATAGL